MVGAALMSVGIVAATTLAVVGVSGGAATASMPRAATPTATPSAVGTPPDPALAQAVANWVTNGGETDLDALGSDFFALEDAANSSDLARMSAGCQQLRSDVGAAQQYDPIPDPQAQKAWAVALADYAQAATDCVAGADKSNMDLITKASKEITVGSVELDKVTARLNQIAG